MLPAPTTEVVLIMALVAAHTGRMSAKKCSRFRRDAMGALGHENETIIAIRRSIPRLDEARAAAATLMRTGCAICNRRDACPGPVE